MFGSAGDPGIAAAGFQFIHQLLQRAFLVQGFRVISRDEGSAEDGAGLRRLAGSVQWLDHWPAARVLVQSVYVIGHFRERKRRCWAAARLSEHPAAPAHLDKPAAFAEFCPDQLGAVAEGARGAEFADDVIGQDW